MRNIKLLIEYDGTLFHGWQIQNTDRTVQGELIEAVYRLVRERPTIHVAGRTDAGVHALGQVANFQTQSQLSNTKIHKGLNYYLSDDVRIIGVNDVDLTFHARYDAFSRTYRYVITTRARAIGRQYAWLCQHDLDMAAMQQAAGYLLGVRVFKAFSKVTPDEKHYLCDVQMAEWRQRKQELTFTIRANRFLHNMIRIIVGTLVEVGRGKLQPEEITKILAHEEREHAGTTVPPHGLVLLSVAYQTSINRR
jgi:tRNA pseudouridine38-40 synthase